MKADLRFLLAERRGSAVADEFGFTSFPPRTIVIREIRVKRPRPRGDLERRMVVPTSIRVEMRQPVVDG